MDGFVFIAPIPEDRFNDVLIHLRNNFMPDEPICKSIKLFERGKPHAEMDAHCLEILSLQLSVMVVDKKTAQMLKADATGLFSQRIFQSLHWECINEVKYKDYVDEDGTQIFKPDPPHESVKVLVKLV